MGIVISSGYHDNHFAVGTRPNPRNGLRLLPPGPLRRPRRPQNQIRRFQRVQVRLHRLRPLQRHHSPLGAHQKELLQLSWRLIRALPQALRSRVYSN